MSEIAKVAKIYHAANLSVIPINATKVPGTAPGQNYSWKRHQSKLIEPADLFDKAWGIGIVAGMISGNLECIDIDTKYDLTGKLFEDFKTLINDNAPGLLKKLVVQKTPSGGYHFLYRVDGNPVSGNQKLANRETTEEEKKLNEKDKIRVLIETRGEGGYFGVYPTPGYEPIYGDVARIGQISSQERDLILSCAMTYNEVFEPLKTNKTQSKVYEENISPFEDYNQNADFQSLLEDFGWKCTRNSGRKFFFLRPGGEQQWSAEYDDNKRLFYVFTTSSEFEGGKAYNAAQVLSILKFKGDYSACAKHLILEGWGSSKHQTIIKNVRNGISTVHSTIDPEQEDSSYLADEAEMAEYEKQWRNGTFVMGLTIGWHLDKYFRFKRGNFNIFNGFDNVGKSTVLWYSGILAAMFHDWRVLIYSIENTNGSVRKKLIEFYWGVPIKSQTPEQYTEALTWVQKHFVIINNNQLRNYADFLNIVRCENSKQHIDLAICDPYNGLKISLADNSKLSTHEYHYEAASEMQLFAKNEDTCIYLNAHVATFAMRNGNVAPKKGDTEGGSKFPNKADDFGTIHRDVQDSDRWMFTEIHMRKIKELETGGGYTAHNDPFIMEMLPGGCGFRDKDGINPVALWHKKRGIEVPNVPRGTSAMEVVPNKLVEEVKPVVGSFAYREQQEEDDLPF